MYQGLLLNALLCFTIAICAIAFAYSLKQQPADHSAKRTPALKALVSFWAVTGIIYIISGLRMFAAYTANPNSDQILYYASSVPFAFMSLPLVYFIIYVITGNRTISRVVSSVFAIFGIIYLAYLFIYGTTAPAVSYWGSIIDVNSEDALNAYISGLFIIPTSMILGLLAVILIQKVARPMRYKISMLLVAISLVFDFTLLDFIAVTDNIQMASRIFVLAGIIFGFLAYFPPVAIKDKLGGTGKYALSSGSEDNIEYDLENDIEDDLEDESTEYEDDYIEDPGDDK